MKEPTKRDWKPIVVNLGLGLLIISMVVTPISRKALDIDFVKDVATDPRTVEAIDEYLHNLSPDLIISQQQMPGQVYYDPPSRMTQGHEQTVTVRISKSATDDLRKGLVGSNRGTIEKINVMPLMSARLSGSAFTVIQRMPENQMVADDGFTEWQFGVTPLESGSHPLTLEVGVRVKLGGSDEVRFHPTTTRTIHVQVDRLFVVTHFASEHWEVLATQIIVPLFTFFLGLRYGKQK